jgi:hypothetical protein
MIRTRFIVVSLLTAGGLAFGFQTARKPDIVRNPPKPVRGELALDLAEDLNIGDEKDENSLFSDGSFSVDASGSIWVLDWRECRVQKFDANGKQVAVFGQNGQGPGDLEQPLRTCLDASGHYYVQNAGQGVISEFDPNGIFVRRYSPDRWAQRFGILADGGFIYETFTVDEETSTFHIRTADRDGRVRSNIADFPSPRMGSAKGRILAVSYYPKLQLSVRPDGAAVFGESGFYRFTVTDPRGAVVRTVEADIPAAPLTADLKEGIIRRTLDSQSRLPASAPSLTRDEIAGALSKLQANLPFFSRLLLDEKGYVFVERYREYDPQDDSRIYDLFDPTGTFICRLRSPYFITHFQDGKAYRRVRIGDEGYSKIQRLKIRNWDSIASK